MLRISRADAIADIEGDLEQECVRVLFDRQLRPPRRSPGQRPTSVAENALATVFEQLDRIPPAARREVLVSARFRAERQTLPAALQRGLRCLLQDVADGADLHPYLSTQVDHVRIPDGLLNQWGIHHFHLGAPARHPKNARYVARTKELLFAVVDMTSFRAIGTFGHGRSFGDVEVLNALRRAWPELVEPWRARGLMGSRSGNPSPRDVTQVRVAGANPVVTLDDGFTYFGPRSITTAGHTEDAALAANDIVRAVRHLAAVVATNVSELKAHVARITGTEQQRLVLSLQLNEHLEPSLLEHRARFYVAASAGRLYYHFNGRRWSPVP